MPPPRRPRRAFLIACLALALLAPVGGAGAATRAGAVGWATGYYPGWQQGDYPPSAIPWASLTHLVHFSLMTGAARDGSIETTSHGLTPQRMRAAVDEAHRRGKLILIGIGGAEDQNWDAACNGANRATFIANLVGVMRQYGYDGIDLDIEQDWQAPAHPDYIACVAGLRAALDAFTPRPLLTAPGDPDWQAAMLAQVWPYLDQINLMDYWRGVADSAAGLANYTRAGVPRALLGVGIGIGDGGSAGRDPAECAAKAQAAIAGGYGGVMVWTVPADAAIHRGQTPCLTALAAHVAAPAPSAAPSAAPLPAGTAPRCFAETRACVRGLFLDRWLNDGGLAVNGYPISGEFTEVLEDGKPYTVQYFERTRLEYHPAAPDPYKVQLGQFGRRIRGGADPPVAAIPGATYFAPTGHNVGPRFLAYWDANGGLAQFGLPIAEEFTETLEDGKPYLVQYFERARFEYHPENPAPYDVLLGQFGRRILAGDAALVPPATGPGPR